VLQKEVLANHRSSRPQPRFHSHLGCAHFYKLGNHFIYPGKKHAELDKLIGQQVEIRAKP
jgi:hypothetical protein